MIKVIVKNCDEKEIERVFENGEEFIKIMNGEGIDDGLMLDDEIVRLEIDNVEVKDCYYINDLYNMFDEDFEF